MYFTRVNKTILPNSMLQTVKTKGRPLDSFKKGDTIHVSNRMVKGYSYQLDEAPGKNFAPDFRPYADPGEILAMGAFEGKYLNDCIEEFPAEWYLRAIALDKLRPEAPDISVNYFEIKSRLPLSEWRKFGWVPPLEGERRHIDKMGREILSDAKKNPDERGWFQWYCRYWMGRRLPELDAVQIRRWKTFVRHAGAIKANCSPGDLSCRPTQRQALLHWAHNPFI